MTTALPSPHDAELPAPHDMSLPEGHTSVAHQSPAVSDLTGVVGGAVREVMPQV